MKEVEYIEVAMVGDPLIKKVPVQIRDDKYYEDRYCPHVLKRIERSREK